MTKIIVMVSVCTFAASIIESRSGLPLAPGLLLCYTAAFLVSYWIPPRPVIGYPHYVLRLALLILLVLAAFWWLPALLGRWTWKPLATGLPVFVLFLALPFLPALNPSHKKSPYWQWMLIALFFGILMGWTEGVLPA